MAFHPVAVAECDCCGHPDVPVTHVDPPTLTQAENPGPMSLCEVCFCSFAGTWYIHRQVHDATKVALGRLIAWGINHLKADAARDRNPVDLGD